jgi:hypothetical protein
MEPPVYRSQAPFAEKESATLVITCTSNAFSPYIREFLGRHLGLDDGSYDCLAVPGGPQFLLLSEYLPKFAWAGQRWMKFLVERHRLKRAVLISHEDCAWHDDDRMVPALLHRLAGAPGSSSPREAQAGELRRMAVALHEHLPPIGVEAYFAEKEADGRVGFVRIA